MYESTLKTRFLKVKNERVAKMATTYISLARELLI